MLNQKVNISFAFLALRRSLRANGTIQMRRDWGMLLGCFMGHQGMRILPTSVKVNGKSATLGSDVWFNMAKDIYGKTTAHRNTLQSCRLCLKDQKGLFIEDTKIKPPFCFVVLGIPRRAVAWCCSYDVFRFPTKPLHALNSKLSRFWVSHGWNCRLCWEMPRKWPLNMNKAHCLKGSTESGLAAVCISFSITLLTGYKSDPVLETVTRLVGILLSSGDSSSLPPRSPKAKPSSRPRTELSPGSDSLKQHLAAKII